MFDFYAVNRTEQISGTALLFHNFFQKVKNRGIIYLNVVLFIFSILFFSFFLQPLDFSVSCTKIPSVFAFHAIFMTKMY